MTRITITCRVARLGIVHLLKPIGNLFFSFHLSTVYQIIGHLLPRNDLELPGKYAGFHTCLWNPGDVRSMKMPRVWEKVELERSWALGLRLLHPFGQLCFIY